MCDDDNDDDNDDGNGGGDDDDDDDDEDDDNNDYDNYGNDNNDDDGDDDDNDGNDNDDNDDDDDNDPGSCKVTHYKFSIEEKHQSRGFQGSSRNKTGRNKEYTWYYLWNYIKKKREVIRANQTCNNVATRRR
jgi:hypothetical protein